jgi:hypothetical protein
MKFNFSFGKKRRGVIEWAKISILLEGIIEFLSNKFSIDKKRLWDIVDEIQRELLKRGWIDDTVNDYVINTPELLDQRVERDVDKAIEDYEKQEIKEADNFFYYEKEPDGSKAQELLGGEIGIRGIWEIDKDK